MVMVEGDFLYGSGYLFQTGRDFFCGGENLLLICCGRAWLEISHPWIPSSIVQQNFSKMLLTKFPCPWVHAPGGKGSNGCAPAAHAGFTQSHNILQFRVCFCVLRIFDRAGTSAFYDQKLKRSIMAYIT